MLQQGLQEDEMKKKLAADMQTFQVKMLEKEQALAEQRKQMEEENERALKSQLDKEKYAQQLREIEVRL